MKRALIYSIVLVLLVLSFWLARRAPEAVRAIPAAPAATTASAAPPPGSNADLGETILRGYADPRLPPENDLTLMSRLMDNAVLLLKSAANRPLSANEDWADLFRGKNSVREVFLPDQHRALNAQGQLVDRWNTPLFFHALGGGRYELRSAGPDQKLWTADDLHRNADGSFRRGSDLESPSLFEAAARPR